MVLKAQDAFEVSEESMRAVAPLKVYQVPDEGLVPSRQGPIKSYWRVVLVALAAGALGVGLTLMALTMYQDHLKTTAMWEYMVKQSQAQAAKAAPTEPAK